MLMSWTTLRQVISAPNTTNALTCIRNSSSNNGMFVNRNPRNLERLRIAIKPDGWHLDKKGRSFWHKLELVETSRLVRATVVHFERGPVLTVSTSDWALRKQLYSPKGTAAFINLGRVFAQRCLEAGLTEMSCNIEAPEGGKVDKFLKELTAGGLRLQESERYVKPHPWDKHRPEKPWEVTE